MKAIYDTVPIPEGYIGMVAEAFRKGYLNQPPLCNGSKDYMNAYREGRKARSQGKPVKFTAGNKSFPILTNPYPDANRYRFWRYMATIEPREMAKILAPCTTQDDLDVAIDTAICERSDIPLEYHSPCKWTPMDADNMPGSFDGECGIAWTFTEGGITENGINFCPKCGRRVVT